MGHTGDGFFAIFEGDHSSLFALLVSNRSRQTLKHTINQYNISFKRKWPNAGIPLLDYGFGVDTGDVFRFTYNDINDPDGSTNVGFIGHTLNVANRVEQATKDHSYPTICTATTRKEALRSMSKFRKKRIWKNMENDFVYLGKHITKGMDLAIELYCFKGHLYKDWEKALAKGN